tara:strand:- start:7711 stop:8319 length:609 start_codon:yes stop_codon:yes gene_type:complete
MAQATKHEVDNGTGAAVRAAINTVFAAAVSQNSGSSEPSGTKYAYMLWADTNTGKLKIRNAANNAWVEVGTLATANLGLAPAASPTITGTADFDSNTAIKCPDGTTAQRPGSASVGMLRYNTTTNSFEGYSGASAAWGEIGGSAGGATGGDSGDNAVFWENQKTVTHDYTITAARGAGSFGEITINAGKTVTIPSDSTWTIV